MNAEDRITITGLNGWGHHGVLEQERREGQRFLVDVVVLTDIGAAAASDDLGDTVDYAAVAAAVVALIEGEPVDLIETLVNRIADRCLEFARVDGVEVTIHKPDAPVGVPFSDVAVTIQRRRDA